MPAADRPPRAPSHAFALMLFSGAALMAGASAPSPFYPLLRQQFGFSSATMTGIFAIYAGAVLLTLLVAGSLSDHLGRRPVIAGGMALLATSVLLFWQAGGTPALFLARLLQGIAAGLLLGALSAAAVDAEPAGRPGSAAIGNTVLPLLGLAAGPLLSGLLLDWTRHAMAAVFGALALLYVALAGLAWRLPETSPRHAFDRRTLRPRVAIPRNARATFWRCAPAVLAGWSTGGFHLSLGAPLVATTLGSRHHLWQSLTVTVLAGTGALACHAMRRASSRRITLFGTGALAVGTALSLAALQLGSLAGYLSALVVAGAGFGTSFYGVMRSVTPLAGPAERAALFSALFVLCYLAFGVPAVLAGMASPHLGLAATAQAYGLAVIVLAATAALLRAFGTRD